MTRSHIVIAGAGPAGLEALLALQQLAGDRAAITLIAPDTTLAMRALSVGEPFAATAPRRFSVSAIAADRGISLVRDTVAAVDPGRHLLTTGRGAVIPYDTLLLAIGAGQVEAVPGAVTFRGPEDVSLVRRLLVELLDSPAPRVAFVAAPATAWTLPVYELALLATDWADARGATLETWVVTHEHRPLDVFGTPPSTEVARLLDSSGVRFWAGAEVELVEDGRLWLALEGCLPVDLAVALAAPSGRAVPGLPHDEHGFTPVDAMGRVAGTPDVLAAGDMTTRPLKQGGLAAIQADTAAATIAASLGADVEPSAYTPLLQAVMLTPQGALHLQRPARMEGWTTEYAAAAADWPQDKVATRRLGAYLTSRPGLQIATTEPRQEATP
jgi:sulfide:quinone oxidoreductase